MMTLRVPRIFSDGLVGRLGSTSAGFHSMTTVSLLTPVPATGTLNFAPGQTTSVVRVDLLNCAQSGHLSFTFKLSAPINATISRASTNITINPNPAALGARAGGPLSHQQSVHCPNRGRPAA
jgi:hypothetical protein